MINYNPKGEMKPKLRLRVKTQLNTNQRVSQPTSVHLRLAFCFFGSLLERWKPSIYNVSEKAD